MSVAEDILEIQMLPQRYADAVMRHNGDDWAATWAKDGEWYLREEPVRGRDEIRKVWEGAMAGFPFAAFLVQPAIVEVNGDKGTCRSYVTEILGTNDGKSSPLFVCVRVTAPRSASMAATTTRSCARTASGSSRRAGTRGSTRARWI